MDDVTIFNPRNGKDRYRIGEDLQVEDLVQDLDDPPCKHKLGPMDERCVRCGRTKQQMENENV